MKRIKKIFGIILLALIIVTPKELNAASGTVSVSSSKTSAVVGSEINITVRLSSNASLGSWEYTLSYDSSKLKLISGTTNVVGYAPNSSTKSQSYSYKFKVISRGTSTVSVKSYDALAFDESKLALTINSVKITAITQAELEASYSKNNNLSSLGVEGFSLNEPFNKETLSYTASVPSTTEKINITGSVEDSKSSVSGLGEKEVTEGENKFEIKVTAQNGGVKTYTLVVNVEDKNPIEVLINNQKYTIIKRVSALTIPETYEASTTNIEGIDVPSFTSTITNFTLVGLKNENGEAALYIYKDGKYTKYTEIKTSGIVLFPINSDKEIKGFTKEEIEINGNKVKAYKYKDNNEFYILYGVNIETGKEELYYYDAINNALAKYNENILNDLNKKIDNYLLIIIVLASETLVLVLILLISSVKKNKRKKKNKKVEVDEIKTLENKE